VSGTTQGEDVDISTVNGDSGNAAESGVKHAAELIAFTEASMRAGGEGLPEARAALRAVLSEEAYIDACAIVCAFNVVDRVADATGIPLDVTMAAMSSDVRNELSLARFASSANTPGAS
jgi:alkylhydroperoxidase family enzyme